MGFRRGITYVSVVSGIDLRGPEFEKRLYYVCAPAMLYGRREFEQIIPLLLT